MSEGLPTTDQYKRLSTTALPSSLIFIEETLPGRGASHSKCQAVRVDSHSWSTRWHGPGWLAPPVAWPAVDGVRAVSMPQPVRRYSLVDAALAAVRLTMALTLRSVSLPPPIRLRMNSTWRTLPPLPVIDSCTRSSRWRTSDQVRATVSDTR